ncbi:cellulose-binding domain-containing protein [Streptomyces sp. SBR177]
MTYTVNNVWNTGFTATVTLKNTGTSTVDGWQVTWAYPGGQRVTSAWNATVAQNGSTVTARNADWNRSIAPGGTASFGVQGSHTGANPAPTGFALDGGACA